MAHAAPQSVHNDPRYQTVEEVGAWDIRSVPFTDPSYPSYFRADCLPVQLLHRPTGLSILTATRRTCGKFEAMIPVSMQGRSSGVGCCRRAKNLMALRANTYDALQNALKSEFGIAAPDLDSFATYALMDRPGPKETADFTTF